jgi:hypothetical protein
MRRLVRWSALVCALALVPSSARAQGRGDVAVGYNFMHLFGENGDSGLNLPAGFFISGAKRVAPGIMVVGELADSTKSETQFGVTATASLWTYAGGLRLVGSERRGLRGPRESAQPFVEILIGGARLSAAAEGETLISGDALAIMPGAGVDVPMSRRANLRVAGKFEFFHAGGNAHAFRLDVGVALHVGRR